MIIERGYYTYLTHIHTGTTVVAINERGELGLIDRFGVSYVGEKPNHKPNLKWSGTQADGLPWSCTEIWPIVIGHLGITHELCECGSRLDANGVCLNKLWTCRLCGHSVDAGDIECAGCGRRITFGPDGMVYPLTMMGLQAAETSWGSNAHT